MKNRISAWIVLGAITIVAALSLAVTNEVTKAPIAQQAVLAEEKARLLVVPGAETFAEIALEGGEVLYEAKAPDGTTLGFVGKSERGGYGGPVEVIAGISPEGMVTGVNVGGSNFSETPGLGARARDAAFTDQFTGKKSPVRLGDSAQDNMVDALTAATITSSAVVAGVNEIAKQVDGYLNPDAENGGQTAAEGTSYGGEAEGFKGPVAVVVTVKDDGTISALKVGDDRFHETDGLGTLALEPEFASSFVGKKLPVALADIDALAGATVTTQAVVDAVNKAYEDKNIVQIAGPAPTAAPTAQPTPVVTEAPVEIPADAITTRKDGFAGPVAVTVSFDKEGRVAFLKIGDADFKETDDLGSHALEPAFAEQFIGKLPPLNLRAANENMADSNIDGISGATVTSQAAVDAVNEAHAQEFPQPVATEAPMLTGTTVSVTKEGFMGPVTVLTTFNPDGTIQSIAINPMEFRETPGYGDLALESAYMERFVGKQPPLAIAEKGAAPGESTVPNLMGADAVTSATKTAQAVVDAVNEAYAVFQSAPNEYTVTKQGFMGPIEVRVSFKQDGTIKEVKIGGEGYAESPGYGDAALDEAFAGRFTGKRPPLQILGPGGTPGENLVDNLRNPDTATSATATMQAILDAINEAFASQP